MWKWIAGILAFVLVALIGTCYAGYRRLTSGGSDVAQALPGSVSHNFTMLTDRDSLLDWLPDGTTATPEHHGSLKPGDTVRVAAATRRQGASGRAAQLWIVREVKAPDVFAIEAIEFDPGGLPHPAFTRRDSLVAAGDSTRVTSTFTFTPLASTLDPSATSSAAASSLLSTADRMRVGAARIMWQTQLRSLARKASSR